MMKNRITPENITELGENEIFVFGSNTAGIHGAGAAKLALKWGAVWEKGIGLYGKTYAIPTKNEKIVTYRPSVISVYVFEFIDFAKKNPHLNFLVTKIGCGLAGHSTQTIAPLFGGAVNVQNISLPQEFWEILNGKI